MPDISEPVAQAIEKFAGRKLFIRWNGSSDFTKRPLGEFSIQIDDGESCVSIRVDDDPKFWSVILDMIIQKSSCIGWNLKPIYSWFHALGAPVSHSAVDLMILEYYVGFRNRKRPESLQDAQMRFNEVVSIENRLGMYWRDIYGPLISRVLPAMEATGIGSYTKEMLLHPCFTPEGSINGRMGCSAGFERGINVHNLTMEEKSDLRIRYDEVLLTFDIKSMEVVFGQWVSQDKNLLEDVLTEDPYSSIWKRCTGKQADERFRDICKVSFLARIFGQGAESLSKKLNIDISISQELNRRYDQNYPELFAYVKDFCNSDPLVDCFGRRRFLENSPSYLGRNFCIQAPSALVCLEKLVRLYDAINHEARILYVVHDGFVVAAPRHGYHKVIEDAKMALTRESTIAKGLSMSVKAQYGERFDKLVSI